MTRSWFKGRIGDLDHAEASRLFDAFVSSGAESLTALERLSANAGAGPADLDELVALATERWADDDPSLALPVWYGEVEERIGLGSVGAALYDGLIHLVATIFRNERGASWRLHSDARPHAAFNNQPLMSDDLPAPWVIVGKAITGARTGSLASSWLRETVQEALDKHPGSISATSEPLFSVYVDDFGPDPWTHSGSLPDEVAHLLGEDGVSRLWAKMAVVPTVRSIRMEDFPERFVIDAPGAAAPALEHEFTTLLRAALDEAAH